MYAGKVKADQWTVLGQRSAVEASLKYDKQVSSGQHRMQSFIPVTLPLEDLEYLGIEIDRGSIAIVDRFRDEVVKIIRVK